MRKRVFASALILIISATLLDLPRAGEKRGTTGAPKQEKVGSEAQTVEPVWRKAVDGIHSKLTEAVELYRAGKSKQAKKMVKSAQFDGYKNSLLETAVRKHLSQKKDFQNNSGFSEIVKGMDEGEPAEKILDRLEALIQSLEADLPGLALVEGAGGKKSADKAAAQMPDKDWSKITDELLAAVGDAIGEYEKGERHKAIGLVKAAYFENYEGAGLEAKIDSGSPTTNEKVGSRFSEMVRRMKRGESLDRIRLVADDMKTDIRNGVKASRKGAANRVTGFFDWLTKSVQARFQ